jgi:transposase
MKCLLDAPPRRGYGWTFKERLEIKAPQKNRKRLNCFGAVNPLKGEVIQMSSKEAKSPAFIRFLKRIMLRYPKRKIWVYADNLPVHKSGKVDEFLEKHSNLEPKYLPPYSPDLNLQEQWWNYERRKLLNNRYFDSRHKLATAISWFGKQTPPEQVMSICNFAPIENLLR